MTSPQDAPSPRQLAGAGALVLASYSFARPSAESLFLAAHPASDLPWAWLAVAVATAASTLAYGRWLGATPLLARLRVVTWISAVSLVAGWGALVADLPLAALAVYVIKDVYIIVVLEVFWSFANTTHTQHHARSAYGWYLAAGTLGSLAGNQAVGPIAAWAGTASNLGFAAVTLVAANAALWGASCGAVPNDKAVRERASDKWLEGLRSVAKSRYLVALVGVVALGQVATNFTDYLYSARLRAAYPDTDARTAVSGALYSVIDVVSLALQVSTPLWLRRVSAGAALLLVPAIAALTFAGMGLFAGFAAAFVAKSLGKSLDYSIFRVGRELLYIPLSTSEKTAGKAVVDMMGYRAAKATASVLLLPLASGGADGAVLATGGLVSLLWLWCARSALIEHAKRAKALPLRIASTND